MLHLAQWEAEGQSGPQKGAGIMTVPVGSPGSSERPLTEVLQVILLLQEPAGVGGDRELGSDSSAVLPGYVGHQVSQEPKAPASPGSKQRVWRGQCHIEVKRSIPPTAGKEDLFSKKATRIILSRIIYQQKEKMKMSMTFTRRVPRPCAPCAGRWEGQACRGRGAGFQAPHWLCQPVTPQSSLSRL